MLARVELKSTPAIAQSLQKQIQHSRFRKVFKQILLSPYLILHRKAIGGNIFEEADKVLTSYPDVMPAANSMRKISSVIETYYKSGADAEITRRFYSDNQSHSGIFLQVQRVSGTQKGGMVRCLWWENLETTHSPVI